MPRFDFKTDESSTGTDDIVLDANGEFQFTSTLQESLVQRIRILLNVWQGEWQYNLLFGTPYRQRIFTSGFTKEEVDAEIVRVISQLTDITSISGIDSTLDRADRVYTLNRIDVFVNNQQLSVPISSPQKKLNIYPDPRDFDDFQICSLGEVTTEEINNFYKLLNFDMSNTDPNNGGNPGDSTWWNTWSSNLP